MMRAVEQTQTAALLDGRYQLHECVGSGGAARVYRAEDVLLGRTVAVKMMRTDADTLVAPSRVRNEIAILSSLTHPSLVELFDAKLVPGRPGYLVMEFIKGRTLAERLYEGPLPPRVVAGLARELASALSAVHGAGVVHRDLKPANILLSPPTVPEAEFHAKLADFGVAYLLDSTRVTRPGTVVGSAAYLAPEQVRGEAATAATDIYALGLVLLEALTGERAFGEATGIGAVMARLVNSPTPPDWAGPEWTRLLTRMTAADPALRPDASEVAAVAVALPDQVRPAVAGQADSVRPAVAGQAAVHSSGSVAGEPTRTVPLPAAAEAVVHPARSRSSPRSSGRRLRSSRFVSRARADRRRALALIVSASAALLCVQVGLWAGGADAPVENTRTDVPAPVIDAPAETDPQGPSSDTVETEPVTGPDPATGTDPAQPTTVQPEDADDGKGNGEENRQKAQEKAAEKAAEQKDHAGQKSGQGPSENQGEGGD